MYGPLGSYGMGPGWGWAVGGGWIMMIVVWGLVAAGVVMLVRYATKSGAAAQPERGQTALEILQRRYAAGELTREQFEAMKRDIL